MTKVRFLYHSDQLSDLQSSAKSTESNDSFHYQCLLPLLRYLRSDLHRAATGGEKAATKSLHCDFFAHLVATIRLCSVYDLGSALAQEASSD